MNATSALCAALLLVACGSAPRGRVVRAVERGDVDGALQAYERFREMEGADADLLANVAGLVLTRAATGDDATAQRAALGQLALAGTAGMPTLIRLAESDGVTPARLGALEALARRGREDAKLALRALADSPEPEVLAASVAGMDPVEDETLLLRLAGSPHAAVRRAALGALADRADQPPVAVLLAEVARSDPEASCRAAAVRALGGSGGIAVPLLRERLGDPAPSVRFAAVAGLMRADPERGRLALAPLLDVAPSPTGIEAARALIQRAEGPDELAGASHARAFLERALAAHDPALRSQAGVALASLPERASPPLDALRRALLREPNAEVRLSLARALLPHDPAMARAALGRLMDEDAGMPAVQAAALLSAEGDPGARGLLERVIDSDAPSILRRTAVRALAREALSPDAVRGLLRDEDPLVRIYAAGGILAAAAAT